MFFHCSDKTRERLMDEYRLTWSEFFEYTKPPICVIWKKDPITGIPMFPKREDYTEEDLEKYAREDIEKYLNQYTDLFEINNNLRDYYKITEEEMLLIVGYNTYILDKESNIRIRNEWIRKIEKYLRNKEKYPKFNKTLITGKVELDVSELSVPYLKEKLKLKKKEAERYLQILKDNFIINHHGIRRREFDDPSASSELLSNRVAKEQIIQKAIEIINRNSPERIGNAYLMRKLRLSYFTVDIIIETLVERGYLERISDQLGGFKVLNPNFGSQN